MGDEVSSETVNTLRRESLSDVDAKEVYSQCFLGYLVSSTLNKLTLSQVWFVGDHCGKSFHPFLPAIRKLSPVFVDVGGGNTPNGRPHALSYIPLRWMIKEALKSSVPILFKPSELAHYGLTLPPTDPVTGQAQGHPDARYYVGTEGRLENISTTREGDVMAPRHDLLRRPSGIPWWLLEVLPVVEYRQKPALRDPAKLLEELGNTSEMHLRSVLQAHILLRCNLV